MVSQADFYDVLIQIIIEAHKRGETTLRITARQLHHAVWSSQGGTHRMPMACNAMWRLWRTQGSREERIISATASGYSSTLQIEFDTFPKKK